MIAYRTDRTTRTFKFDFPGNLCRVPCAILAMFCLYLSLFLSLQPSNLSRRLFLKPPPCLAAGPVIQSCQNLFPPSLVALLQLQYAPHRTIYFSCRRNKCCLAAKIYLTADAWAKIFNSKSLHAWVLIAVHIFLKLSSFSSQLTSVLSFFRTYRLE